MLPYLNLRWRQPSHKSSKVNILPSQIKSLRGSWPGTINLIFAVATRLMRLRYARQLRNLSTAPGLRVVAAIYKSLMTWLEHPWLSGCVRLIDVYQTRASISGGVTSVRFDYVQSCVGAPGWCSVYSERNIGRRIVSRSAACAKTGPLS